MDCNVEEELSELKRQNEMSLEDILNELPADYFKVGAEVNNNDHIVETETNVSFRGFGFACHDCNGFQDEDDLKAISKTQGSVEEQMAKKAKIATSEDRSVSTDVSDTEDVQLDENSEDCEDTMVEQEKHEENDDDLNHRTEIDDLVNDADVPIEELLQLYRNIYSGSGADEAGSDAGEDLEDASDMEESSSNLSDSDDANSASSDSTSASYESSVDLGVVFNTGPADTNDKESLKFQVNAVPLSRYPRVTPPSSGVR